MPSSNEPRPESVATDERSGTDRRSGKDRRAGTDRRGRTVKSRGPIIRTLELVAVLSGGLSATAFIFSLIVFGSQLDTIQRAREQAAFDSCKVLDVLINSSANQSEHIVVYDLKGKPLGVVKVSGSDQRRRVQTFIRQAGLADCVRYARNVRQGTLPTLR